MGINNKSQLSAMGQEPTEPFAEFNTDVDSLDNNDLRLHIEELKLKYRKLVEHTETLTKLSDTAVQMMNQKSLDSLLQFIAEETVRLSEANGAYLHMVHETGDYLSVVAACGDLSEQLRGKIRRKGEGLSTQAWVSKTYSYTENFNKLTRRTEVFPQDCKAVAIPLQFSGVISGVAFITSAIDKDLKAEIPLLQEFSKIAALAIFYRRQYESHSREMQRIKALNRFGEQLYQSEDQATIWNQTSQHVFEIMEADTVTIYQLCEKTGELVAKIRKCLSNGNIEDTESKPNYLAHRGINHWCFINNKFAQIDRHFEDPREDALMYKFRKDNNIGSTLCVPISDYEKPVGVIVASKIINKRNYRENDANTIKVVASQVATALQRNEAVQLARYQANSDSLTNLPNRRNFEDYFSEQINKDKNAELAVLFCDLDGFKNVNDSHGHAIGDQVLKICASRLSKAVRSYDYLARLGGDEFAILIDMKKGELEINEIAKRFVDSITLPINVNGIRIQIGMCIGISFFPSDGKTFSELLQHADVAMFQAKDAGTGQILHYNKNDSDQIREKNQMRSELPGGLARNEFELWYQPQVNWRLGKVVGVEALVRWNHPERGMVSPFVFIPIAEESGLIEPMGLWIMEQAITQLKQWESKLPNDFSVAVNIAPPQFVDPEFSNKVIALIEKHAVNPKQLKAEITESFIINKREDVVKHLKQLRSHGIAVAIDDFGTGYSSLSYLQDLPIDVLKIDRAFVCALNNDNYNKSIAASIIALANSLDLTTITEGVESEEQLSYFKELGSDIIQGYLFSKPVTAAEVLDVVEQIEKHSALGNRAA